MDPVKKSLYLQTGFGLALLGATFLASSRAAPLLPGLSKKGLLLTEGTLLSSSIAYNYFRGPEKTSLLEKMALSTALSFVATKWISPKAAFAAGAATFVFSAAITKLTALTPLEKAHLYYTKNPEQWKALDETKRSQLFSLFFDRDLPLIPINAKVTIAKRKAQTILQNPEKYTRNQLSTFTFYLFLNQEGTFTEKTCYFMQYLVAKKIPIFSFVYALRNASPIKETLYELFKKEPIQQFVTQRKPEFLSLRPPLPALHELIEALTPKAIEAMPPHLIFAWGAALHQNHQAFSSLDFNQRLAFVLRFDQYGLSIPDALYSDAIKTQIKSQPDQCGPKALSWMLQKEMQKANGDAIIVSHTELPLLIAAHKQGVPLPPFKLTEAILGNSTAATEIETLFRAYPLYQFIGKNEARIKDALKPLPTLETHTKTLTLASIQTMDPHSVRAWYAILKAKADSWKALDPVTQIAFLARFKELGLKMEDFEQPKISADDLKQYSLETLKFLSAGFSVSLDDVTEIANDYQIAFLKAWHEKGGEVPPFTDNRHEKTENLDALNATYPHYRFLQGEVVEMEESKSSKPPTFSSITEKLTPNAVNKMSSLQLKAYLEIFGKDASRWDNLAPKVALAFLQQFFAHHLITEVPEGAKKHIENIVKCPKDYSNEEIQWYLQTCLTPKEDRDFGQPTLSPKIYTISPKMLSLFEKALNDGIQLPLFKIDGDLQKDSAEAICLKNICEKRPIHSIGHSVKNQTTAQLPSFAKLFAKSGAIEALSYFETATCYSFLQQNEGIWNALDVGVQARFLIQIAKCAANPGSIEDLSGADLFDDYSYDPSQLSSNAKKFCRQSYEAFSYSVQVVQVNHLNDWEYIKDFYKNNIPPPVFHYNYAGSKPKELEQIYAKHLPHRLMNTQEAQLQGEINDIFSILKGGITPQHIERISHRDILHWYAFLNARSQASLPEQIQIALMKRFIAADLEYIKLATKLTKAQRKTLTNTNPDFLTNNQKKWLANPDQPLY